MPKHYARDANVLNGAVTFNNTKTAYVYFTNSLGQQISFSRQPFVSLTVLDSTASPATRISWLKNGNLFIGCVIRFATNYTGNVDWEVREA